ncbi:MAG: cytochrome c-type biogenesis protein CcmH [Candidatus Polarisedimenticolia bacterium]
MLRRSIVGAAVLLLAAAALPAQSPPDPHRHNEGGVTGPIVESPEAIQVTGVILCFCGGCVNQTIHECTCGLAAEERAKVAQALAGGATPASLIAGYIAEHGPQVRVVPERTGLNLIGWAVPFIAAVAGLGTLTVVLLAWRRRAVAQVPAAAGPALAGEADRLYRERIAHDLEDAE